MNEIVCVPWWALQLFNLVVAAGIVRFVMFPLFDYLERKA